MPLAYVNALVMVLEPAAVVTTRLASPGACAGVVAEKLVAVLGVMLVSGTPPSVAVMEPAVVGRPEVAVTVIRVPPSDGPLAGLTTPLPGKTGATATVEIAVRPSAEPAPPL